MEGSSDATPYYKRVSYLGFKSHELEYTFQKKHCCEANVEAIQHASVEFRFLVILKKKLKQKLLQEMFSLRAKLGWQDTQYSRGHVSRKIYIWYDSIIHTCIIRTTVLHTINAKMRYSNACDVTTRHIWNCRRFSGMYRLKGLALRANSIHWRW